MVNSTLGLLINDPIERLIIEEYRQLKEKNKRLNGHIDKTKSWLTLKDISSWKAFDFYHYFCQKYNEKYKREFRLARSAAVVYNNIESFIRGNNIDNDDYKEFIDLAFSRYFNPVIKPTVGYLWSASLYNKLKGTDARRKTPDDLFALDKKIEEESARFEEEIKQEGAIVYGKHE